MAQKATENLLLFLKSHRDFEAFIAGKTEMLRYPRTDKYPSMLLFRGENDSAELFFEYSPNLTNKIKQIISFLRLFYGCKDPLSALLRDAAFKRLISKD